MGVLAQIEQKDQDRTVEDYYKLDVMFHRVILRMSNNRAILQAWETMSPVIYTLLSINASSDYRESYMREFTEKHKSILDLIILRDAACVDLMKQHIEDAKMVTLGVLEEIDSGALI
jgi:DNA-binding GntR family transcriptional regulator